MKTIGIYLTFKIYFPFFDPSIALRCWLFWYYYALVIFIRKFLGLFEPAFHHPPPLVFVEIELFLELARWACGICYQDCDEVVGYAVDYFAVLSHNKFQEGFDVGEDGGAVGAGHHQKPPEGHHHQMLHLKYEKHQNYEDTHFAQQIDEVHQNCLVLAEQKLAPFLVNLAIIFHPILQKHCVLLRNDQPFMSIFVTLQFEQSLEYVIPSEVQQKTCQKYGHLQVVYHQSNPYPHADRLVWVFPGYKVNRFMVKVYERVQFLCEVVNQFSKFEDF